MKKYILLLNGQNFWLNLDGEPKRIGFFTTRFIQAKSEEEAENLGVQMIREDKELFLRLLNDNLDPPMIFVDEIEEIEPFNGIEHPDLGYAFYPEENNA